MGKSIWPLFLIIILIIIVNGFIFIFVLPYFQEEIILKSNIREPIYIAPYMGDIDGEVSEDWFFFYEKLLDFHNDEKIITTVSFYPGSIQDDKEFNKVFKKMYESKYIELMQKSYKGDESEMEMYKLSPGEQKEIIKSGRDHFKNKMKDILNKDNIKLPISYNQISGRITNDTRNVLEELGFKIYFDMFVEGDLSPVESTENFDVIEYGVSFTDNGGAGREHVFKSSEEIFNEINNFSREDVNILTINGRKVIPIWTHQQDFEDSKKDEKLDKEKWKTYTQVLRALENDPNVEFITPERIYNLGH